MNSGPIVSFEHKAYGLSSKNRVKNNSLVRITICVESWHIRAKRLLLLEYKFKFRSINTYFRAFNRHVLLSLVKTRHLWYIRSYLISKYMYSYVYTCISFVLLKMKIPAVGLIDLLMKSTSMSTSVNDMRFECVHEVRLWHYIFLVSPQHHHNWKSQF